MKKLGLCVGRHEIAGVNEYIYPNELNPLDLNGMEMRAKEKLAGVKTLKLYVTGLTVALVAVINVCRELNIKLTLMHYNRDNGEYYSQEVK